MRRLGAELAILATPADFGGDDGAELHIAPDKADADLVRPVKQIVQLVGAGAGKLLSVVPIEQRAAEHFFGQSCNGYIHAKHLQSQGVELKYNADLRRLSQHVILSVREGSPAQLRITRSFAVR